MGRGTLIVLLVLGLAACGGDNDSELVDTSTEDTTGKVGYDEDATDAMNYDIAYQTCEAFSPEDLADDLGTSSTDPLELATAYAEGSTERYRRANFEGCLDALQGSPKDWP